MKINSSRKKKRKILIRLPSIGGGAVRSIFEYIKILNKNNYEIVVVAEITEDPIAEELSLYTKNIYDICPFQIARFQNIVRNFKTVIKSFSITKKEEPDLIVSVSDPIYSIIGKFLNVPTIMLIAGGQARNDSRFIKKWNKNPVIVFSVENKRELLSLGYPNNKIHVVSQRIQVTPDDNYQQHYNKLKNKKKTLILLITSRVCEGKMNSIYNLIDFAAYLSKKNEKFQLRIAGDGDLKERLHSYLKKYRDLKKHVIILGHVTNIDLEFQKAHLVFGKARSVLEPTMKKRIGYVVNEDFQISKIDRKNYKNLYENNFSGRNSLNQTSFEQIYKDIENLRAGNYDLSKIEANAEICKEDYDVSKLEKQIIDVINKSSNNNKKRKKNVSLTLFLLITQFINLYFLASYNYIIRRVKRKTDEKWAIPKIQ